MQRGYSDYKRARAVTADSGELLLMLFDGAIRLTHQAIARIDTGDVSGKCEAISRALAIVSELHGTLDFEVNAEISGNLASLYVYILENYSRANIEGTIQPLKEILVVLDTLREGWVGAIQEVRRNQKDGAKVAGRFADASSLSVMAG